MNDESIALRPAADDELELSYRVKKAAEGELIRRTFGWDEAFQRDFHRKDWTASRPEVIELDGKPIGTVAIIEGDGYIEVGQFFILPEYQSRGIGSVLLGRVLRRADTARLVVRLAFLKGNRAERLYRRHGFELVKQTETYCYMERRPRGIN
jgi:GNAT superfamily N-acetyltransferase